MNSSNLELIEKWKSDPTFLNWANGSNQRDVAKWEAYFEKHPELREVAEVGKFSLIIKPAPIHQDRSKSLESLSKLQSKMAASDARPKAKVRQLQPFNWLSVAASLLILVTCFWGYFAFTGDGKEMIVDSGNEQKELFLADGTKVILNAHSTLKYFEKNVRNVQLNGEAYFEVTKKPQTKANFQVMTEDLTITVLGTEFNVNSKNGQTSVYLDEGKVKLALGAQETREIEMKPGDLVSYSGKRNEVLENRKAHSLEETAWKEKVILFEEASIAEVLQSVGLIYGIRLESDLSNSTEQSFTGGIPTNDLDITLQTLKDVFQFEIRKIEEKYIVE